MQNSASRPVGTAESLMRRHCFSRPYGTRNAGLLSSTAALTCWAIFTIVPTGRDNASICIIVVTGGNRTEIKPRSLCELSQRLSTSEKQLASPCLTQSNYDLQACPISERHGTQPGR